MADTYKSLLDMCILQLSRYLPLCFLIYKLKSAFAHLRYFFGDNRPSQTTNLKMSYNKLRKIKIYKDGISFLFTTSTYTTQKK